MQRNIVGFAKDELDDWTALLDCGHKQHTRHNPPFVNRPWVQSASQRQAMIGEQLNCKRCDDLEIPEHFIAYKKTPVFDQHNVPKGLLKSHSTQSGVWARIEVLQGRLAYHIEAPLTADFELTTERSGVVIAEVSHRIKPLGEVRFYVEFYRAAKLEMSQ